MREFILELSYETNVIRNLKKTWIQPLMMSPGWVLCYEDDLYIRGAIYRSTNKKLLAKLQDRMMEAYGKGQTIIYI